MFIALVVVVMNIVYTSLIIKNTKDCENDGSCKSDRTFAIVMLLVSLVGTMIAMFIAYQKKGVISNRVRRDFNQTFY